MAAQNKLTDREWALVEDVSKEFGYWRRIPGRQSEEYPVKEKDLVGLLGIVSRLSKEKEEPYNG